jgi:hypothetical protein
VASKRYEDGGDFDREAYELLLTDDDCERLLEDLCLSSEAFGIPKHVMTFGVE